MKKRLTMFLTCLFMSLGVAIAQQKMRLPSRRLQVLSLKTMVSRASVPPL